MMPTPRLGAPVESTPQAVWHNVYLPPPQVVPKRLSKSLRTSCSPIISARVFAQNRASSFSSRVPVAQVSGFAVIKVKYCCCLLPAPHATGARRLVYVREASQGLSLAASSFGEFRSSEPEAVGSYSTTTPEGGGLYARSLLIVVSRSESSTETPMI